MFGACPTTALATDWDTLHSQAIAPERTAWLIDTLGFKGRANHYAGAMWFYELSCAGNQYASAAIVFTGAPRFGDTTTVTLAGTPLQHVNLIGDTAQSIAKAFELLITAGSSAVWAHADGTTLTITARTMGLGRQRSDRHHRHRQHKLHGASPARQRWLGAPTAPGSPIWLPLRG